MKKYSISTIGYTLSYALLIFCLLFSDQVSAQTCITWEADMKNPWPVLWFTGRAEDYVRVKKVGDGDNAWYWLDNDFSIDIWVYNTLPWTMLANTYSTVWKAGYIDDIRRNMHLVFIRGTTGDLYIRVSDGVGIGNTDIVYQIKETDYLNNFYKKWVHLTVTWEKWNNPVYKDGGTVRLFINGVKPGAGEQDWDYFYNIGVSTTLVIGSTGQPGKGFRGLLSGYRLWEEITLSKTEIKYIKDRSFCDTSSFNSTYAYLYDHLTVNMITMEDSVTSLNGGSPDARAHRVELEETPDLFRGVGYKIFHPTGPFPPGDITDQRECSSIRLDWSDYTEEATGYPGSHEIWRKYGTDSLLLCTTNDKYYIDSAGLVPGREYTYLIRSKWFQPVDFLFYNPSLYRFALEIPGVTTSVKTLPYPETISISEDASTGKCDGSVMIEWAEVNGASSYDVYYQVNNGDTLYLGESTNTTYSHAVSPEELGDTLRYFVEAKGDGDCYLLSPRSGIASANTKCNTKPVNQVATVEGDNIMLTWDFTQSGAPATEFKILRDPGTGIYETIAPSISILDREFTDYDAVMCNGYKYKIMARNACGDSEDATSLATTEVTIPQQFDNVFDHTPAYFDASKGYYNTKVVLVWAVNPDKKGDIETFEIYRKNIDLSSYTLIATIDNKNATYWEDKAVDANTMFMYMIRATGKCDALQVISDSLTAIGFRTNTGIISGKVTYEGGNAVEGVEVRVKSEGVTRAKSINFDGIDVKMISEKSLLEMGSLHTGALSVDCWIRPGKMSPTERHYIFTSDSNSLFICLKNMRPFAGVDIEGGPTVSIDADTVLNDSTWYHLVLNFDPAGSMDIYLDGNRINSADFTPVAAWSSGDEHIMIGGRYFTFFTGQIDEVRIWNRFRTAEEIKRDYTRLLAGNETGLVAYWRFNEGVGSFAYDISRAGDLFHKNNLYFSGSSSPSWSDLTPGFEQLHPSGVTNASGNYNINGIAYSGTGNIFSVTPILGIHKFNPADLNLFIGDNSPVHNNINFTDESSFRFTGKVVYKNTDNPVFPVKGAYVFIDNRQVLNAGGAPVETNQYGEFDIRVPIGKHYIGVKKNKHVLRNNGQWPKPNEYDPYLTYDFQDDVYDIKFTDTTTVKVAGRFVGGDREGNKLLGFGKSKNNIGTGTIVLSGNYDIDLRADKSSFEIQYKTNSESGEFEMLLLPEVYLINSVESDINPAYKIEDLPTPLDLTVIPEFTTVTDTVYTETIEGSDTIVTYSVYSYAYHFDQKFIYYSQPEIFVYGADESAFAGEEEIVLVNPETEENDTIDLSPPDSPFRYPVFLMAHLYDIDIRVNEVYENGSETDVVPVEDANVTITNNLEFNAPTNTFKTDVNGQVTDYTFFRAGMPNLNKDKTNLSSYTKTLTITASTKKYDVTWREGNIFRAYILGAQSTGGANFITYGPEVPVFILRDPPGSNSYSFLKTNSQFATTRQYSFTKLSKKDYDNELKLGFKLSFGGDIIPHIETEIKKDIKIGIETQTSVNEKGEFVKSYRFLKEFRTSNAPDAVGSNADVYIGESTNMFFTETKNLGILPRSFCEDNGLEHLDTVELASDTAKYSLGLRNGFAAAGDTAATTFIYSQDHILNSLLPTYRKLIFNLMSNPAKYKSNLPADHIYYGMANDSILWAGTDELAAHPLNPSYEFLDSTQVDSVDYLNQQISIWIQTIALNEAVKTSEELDLVENISFDGTAGAYTNEITSLQTQREAKEYHFNFNLITTGEAGFTSNKFGLQTKSKSVTGWDKRLTEQDESSYGITWGYVLDDPDMGDYFSVDVRQDNAEDISYYAGEFLNTNNFEETGKNMETLTKATGGGNLALSITLMVLPKLINPLSGYTEAIKLGYTLATSAFYAEIMGRYKKDIAGEEVDFGINGTSPIFRILGGQSRCPYEGPEYTVFHINPVSHEPYLLQMGTQPHESPAIAVEPASIVNVPANKKALFTIKLTNNSPTGRDLTYVLKIDEASNPDGAEIRVDGLSPNRPFFIPAGQTLTKTMTVGKGATSEMDFEGLKLILHSGCQYNPDDYFPDIADTVSFSAHFLPACTEVEFGNLTNNWVINMDDNNTIMVELKGYDINHDKLDKLMFQYNKPGTSPVTAMNFYKSEDDFNSATEPKTWLEGKSSVNYNFPVTSISDGNYEIMLKSLCFDGSTYSTEKLNGIIDRILPRPFGTPQPADGIVSTGENISIMFNEEIDAGNLYMYKDYISVTGMLNGTDLTTQKELLHDVSLHFDGIGQNVTIPAGINLSYSPFTIEFWAKRSRTGQECIISQGDPDNGGLWIGFDAGNHFIMRVGGQTVTSENIYADIVDQWCHFACVLNNGTVNNEKGITLIIATASTTEEKYQEITADYTLSNGLIMASGPDGFGFNGYLQHVRLWNTYRTLTETNSQRYQLLTGYEKGLVGYWPMDDAAGDIARDLASGRNGIISATWSVSRDNKAIGLDGTGYVEFGTGTMVFNQQSDFTIEFWFKADQQDACLFSNGKADGTDGYVSNWAILTHGTGNISVMNHGRQIFAIAPGYLDGQWHHLALVIDRQSSARIYMDGNLASTQSVSGLTGFGAAKTVLGARWWYDFEDHYDNQLDGVIDEVRIWNSARRLNLIRENLHTALSGNEPGLKAYFPFENVNVSDPSISVNTLENSTLDSIGVGGDCVLATGSDHTGEAPTIKLPRPVVSIPFNYVINEDQVIIEPNIEPSLIENQILTMSIRNVRDLHNNKMASTVTWTAFIDENSLVWEKGDVSLVKKPDEVKEFTVQIFNKGGQKEYFTIHNYPGWLEVSDDHGAIEPLGSKEIRFTVFPGLNPGLYEANLYLAGNLEYNERLQVEVNVKAEPPLWQVDENDFEYSMSVIGQLKIDETLSTDIHDLVGAFRGQECVGVANVSYFKDQDIYLVFINIYSHESSGGPIHFKVWDADQNRIYPEVIPVITFTKNSLIGTPTVPEIIHALNIYSNTNALAKGWNWISFNLSASKLADIDSMFADLSLEEGDLIKGPDENNAIVFDTYDSGDGKWQGTLSNSGGLDITRMYMLKLALKQDLLFSGKPVVTGDVPVTLTTGWNWIGYTPQENMTVKEAFGYHLPVAEDQVKSQYGFSIYDDLMGWIGSLEYLKPGRGYMYYSHQAGSFYYPEKSSLKSSIDLENETLIPVFAYQWPDNMTIVAKIVPVEKVNEDYVVHAYQNNTLTGAGITDFNENTGEWLWFIQVFGDTRQEKVSFIVENPSGTEKLMVNEEFLFQADDMIGTLTNPVVLTLGDEQLNTRGINVYPNPFSDALFISAETREFTRIELIDTEGRILRNYSYKPDKKPFTEKLDLPEGLKEGIYILKILGTQDTHYIKIVKQ